MKIQHIGCEYKTWSNHRNQKSQNRLREREERALRRKQQDSDATKEGMGRLGMGKRDFNWRGEERSNREGKDQRRYT